MLRAFDEYGNLAYTFVETVAFMHGPHVARVIAGLFFLSGMFVMAYNVYMTIARAKQEEGVSAVAAAKA
jgi:cytochrome c oxidase cbb3-type subunit 1